MKTAQVQQKPSGTGRAWTIALVIFLGAVLVIAAILALGGGTSFTLKSGSTLPSFSATDLDGTAIDNSFFASHRVTMVNVWGTFCGPCIEEMPDLAQLPAVFAPADFALVGIVADTSYQNTSANAETTATARQLIASAKATYRNIIPDRVLVEKVLPGVSVVPTTFFVDSSGKLIGDPIEGSGTKDQWVKLIQSVLDSLPATP
ncbi:MAG TPA: TlpA disulfide reductase family protein [Candidatus Cryosericum sp.]|nr:TlpA disulfide reductase family protein [Candidatus Cryosericum sp.]